MHYVVCIKQVPDVASASHTVRIHPLYGTLIREGVPSVTNRFDLYALEAALELRDAYGGKITAVTMGPPQAEAVLRDAIAMGVDDAVLLSDPTFAGADTLATSFVLARAIERLEPAAILVFAGLQAIDGDTGQVGPGISRRLGWTQLTYINRIGLTRGGTIEVERLLDDGREVLEARLPAVVTVVKDINEPRLPSLRGLRRAKTAVIPTWNADRLGLSEEEVGLAGSPTQVIKVFTPTVSSGGEMTQAPASEAAAIFVKWLEDNRILKES